MIHETNSAWLFSLQVNIHGKARRCPHQLNRLSGGSADRRSYLTHLPSPALWAALLSGKPSINYSYQQIMHHSVLRQGLKDRCFALQWIFSQFYWQIPAIFCQQSQNIQSLSMSPLFDMRLSFLSCYVSWALSQPSKKVSNPSVFWLTYPNCKHFFFRFPSVLSNMNYNWNRIQLRHSQKWHRSPVAAEMPPSLFSPEILATCRL